jgi:SAM-dependent methyltransferase
MDGDVVSQDITDTRGTRFAARGCPLCQSAQAKLLFQQSFDRLSGAQLLDGYDVVICEDCGAGYADHIPSQAAMDEYYRELSKYDYADRGGKEPPAAEQRFEEIATVLEKFISSPEARIFEIGCASGQLLKVLQTRGFPNVLGSDPSAGCVRAAQELYDVSALVSTVFTAPEPAEPFDFLILIGVMEHIRDLERAVDKFHCLLKIGGRVYLEVPDASRYAPSLDAPFQEFSVEHINFFSARSLTNLMHARGFHLLTTGLVVRPQNEVTCPAVYGIYERSAESAATERDNETETGLRVYIEGCKTEDFRMRQRIEQALAPGQRMIVWGVGTHTLRLLATGGLDSSKIVLFVDSNPKYQNQDLHGIPVVGPDDLKNHPEPILISSRGFQSEIQHQIQHELKLSNPLILLYDAG